VIPVSEKTRTEKIYSAFFEQEFPADLVLMVLWLAGAIGVIYLPILNDSILRSILSLPMVLFIPGYCLIAALFPKKGDIDIFERIFLSIGLSIALGPLIGLGLNFTMWGIRLEPVVLSLTLFSWIMVLVAKYRRAILLPEEQFGLHLKKIPSGIQNALLPTGGKKIGRLLNSVLVMVAILAIITTAFVIAFPKQGERFSEFFILGENQRASDYPDQVTAGKTYPLYIGVGNQELRTVAYTIETWSLQVDFDNQTNTSHLITMDLMDRLPLVLAQNETRLTPYDLSVKKPGYNRVEFLLFNESVPGPEITGSDRISASYRNVHLWITVS
jgi:uncharacterized membrane protein